MVRHGETEWSREFRHTGRTDVPLTAEGRRRAADLADVLAGQSFDRVLCSPLRRARDTCELAGFADGAEVDDDLMEWDYGEYEGATALEIRADRPGWSVWKDGPLGGESLRDLGTRVDRVIADVCDGKSQDVLIFAHGHLLRVLAARWIGLDAVGGSLFVLLPTCFGVLGHERETRTINGWNTPTLQ